MEKGIAALKEKDDPDGNFLMSLFPHYQMIPEHAKLDMQIKIINLIKRYKLHSSSYPNYQTYHTLNLYCSGPSSYPQFTNQSLQPSNATLTLLTSTADIGPGKRPVTISPSPISPTMSAIASAKSDSLICEDYFNLKKS